MILDLGDTKCQGPPDNLITQRNTELGYGTTNADAGVGIGILKGGFEKFD